MIIGPGNALDFGIIEWSKIPVKIVAAYGGKKYKKH
jgi:hypothetical protein